MNYEYKYQKYKNKINDLLGGKTLSRNSESRKAIKKSKLLSLEILSWNIGKNIKEEIFKNKILPSMGKSDILVFGLQEIPINVALPNKVIKKFKKILSIILPKYKILGNVSTCKNKVSAIEGFGIGIFILVKDEIYHKCKIIRSKNDCPKKTKGYVGVTLNVNNIEIDIFNTHMPFGNIEKSNKFYDKFVEWQKKKFFKSENKIVFGDVNSRSLVTSECYDKDIKMCGEGQEPLYCQLKSKLEKISDVKETAKLYNVGNTTNDVCYGSVKDCSIKQKDSINTLDDITTLLVKNDYIGNPPRKNCPIFKGYDEGKIRFLPTYKRDTKTGLFSLSKKGKGRLPGYADRIFHKGKNLKSIKYNSLPIIGNDHLPLNAIFKIK